MFTPSRKRRVISLDQKKEIIEASVGKNSEDLSSEFGIPASPVRNILSDKAAILKAIKEGGTIWAELGAMQLTEIAADVSTPEELEAGSDTEVTDIEEAPEPLVTAREATATLKVFQRFVEEISSDPTVIQLTDKLDDFLDKERVQKFKQRNLLDYFSPNL